MDAFLGKAKRLNKDVKYILEKYGQIGVDELSKATPVRTGLTASSWYYTIETDKDGYVINWSNSNIQNGINVALIIQLGHGTKSGGYVPPNDYINPALKDIFDQIAIDVWREVSE
ncbi:MAG: HK97 gp10 family phage protein [Lachnospiraceae bacterium]|nr:HK97 gp10 family phage protein [Lachnospiraceae bacterium]